MRDLVTLMLITIALAWCADHVAFGPVKHNRRQRLIVCTVVIIILLAGFAGLRTRCNDTGTYRYSYKLLTEKLWEASDKSIGSNPLFNWVNYRLKMHGVSTQNFLMFWAFLTVGCYLIFVHKYSVNFPLSVFLLFTTGCYIFAFAGIKQAAAVGISVIATMFALKKKWLLFAVGILIATLIHPYSLMYLAVPFMTFKPWTKITYWMLAAFIAAGARCSARWSTSRRCWVRNTRFPPSRETVSICSVCSSAMCRWFCRSSTGKSCLQTAPRRKISQ